MFKPKPSQSHLSLKPSVGSQAKPAAMASVGLSVIGIVWYIILWSLSLLGCLVARKRYRSRPRSPLATARNAPGVSILRPLKGLENNLYENLESTFRQEYHNYEIFFCVADPNDQALPVVRELISKYPKIKASIVIGEETVDVNPKVNNLMRAYRMASNDILWVLDSNVLSDPGTLARSVDALSQAPPHSTRRVGLVHHVPFAFVNEPRFGSCIEEAFLNTNHARMYIAINTLAIDSCVVGKSNLYRRSELDLVDGSMIPKTHGHSTEGIRSSVPRGLAAFGRFLAEDNMIAKALWQELGMRHELSCDVARNVVGNMSFSDYVWRRVRWIRVRKRMALAATLLEPFTESVVLGIVASRCALRLLDLSPWIFLMFHFVFWLLVDLDVYASLAGHPPPEHVRWSFLTAWVVRELLAFPIWLIAMIDDEVEWRGQKYRVLRNGEAAKSVGPSRFANWIPHSLRGQNTKSYEYLHDLE
ncbi:Glycosyltransferase like family 2 domain containing protein [Amanita muscaria]